jgi:hypothetical protein
MFELEKEIATWRNEMYRRGIKRADVLDELENHLREDFKRRMSREETEPDAFACAMEQLGNSELLKQEFSKISRGGWMMWTQNPVTLNILALWFIVAGLNALFVLMQHWRFGQSAPTQVIGYYLHGFLLIIGCQALMGVGLLYRVKLARYFALGWAAIASGLFLYSQIYFLVTGSHGGHPTSLMVATIGGTVQQLRYIFLGISLPIIFLQIISYLNLALLLWSCLFLGRPDTRQLFQSQRRYV